MKIKTTTLLLSLVLSFWFFAQHSVAVPPSGLSTVPHFYNPAFSDITTLPPASDDESPCANPIVFTKRDALENTTAENTITIAQGQWIKVDLGKVWIEGVYDSNKNYYVYENPWSLQQDNKNLKSLIGGWNDEGARPVMPPKKQWWRITEEFGVYYCLYAAAVGEATLTFTYHGQFSAKPKVLTFRFNIVEAPTAPANGNEADDSEK